MIKKVLRLMTPLMMCLFVCFSVSARKPAPYIDNQTAVKYWNSAYAVLHTSAEVCDGYYSYYSSGYWTKSLPVMYSATTGGITHVSVANGIRCDSTVKFNFSGTSSSTMTASTFHYYK